MMNGFQLINIPQHTLAAILTKRLESYDNRKVSCNLLLGPHNYLSSSIPNRFQRNTLGTQFKKGIGGFKNAGNANRNKLIFLIV